MSRFQDFLDEGGFTPAGFFGGLLVMGVGLAFIAFCAVVAVHSATSSSQSTVSSSPYATTFRQDGHLFIRAVGGGLLHHPDCQCLTAEKVQ